MTIYKIFDSKQYYDEKPIYIKGSSSIKNELKFLIGDINAYSFIDMYEALQGSKRKEYLTPQETIDVINHFYDLELEYTSEIKDFINIDIFKEMNLIIQKYQRSSNKFNDAKLFSNIKFTSFSFDNLDAFIIDMQLQDYYNDIFNDLEKEEISNG